MFIPATATTPLIKYSEDSFTLEIIGRSIPEDAMEFYEPVFRLLNESQKRLKKTIKVLFQFEYFNTHTSRMLLDILKQLEKLKDDGLMVNAIWICEVEDEETIHFGEDIQTLIKVPMEITLLEEDEYDERLQSAIRESQIKV
ncbi:MAG: DUF1987 domain-containing protein [Flavobacteriales bacterium]|nr:DUF1987 domain-containing protein [Flavobacteriales bacterium]